MVKKFFKRIVILSLSLIAIISILLIKSYIDSFHIKLFWGYDYQKTTELENLNIDFIYNNEKINFKNPIYVKNNCVFTELDDLSKFIGFNYYYEHPLIDIGTTSYLIFENDGEKAEYAFSQKSQEENGGDLLVIPKKASIYNMPISEKAFVTSDNLVYFPIYDILVLFGYSIENWNNNQIIIKSVKKYIPPKLISLKEVNIKYNNKEIIFNKIKPVFIDYLVYFPVKDLFEAMGYKVVWLNNGSPSKLGVGKDNAGLLVTKDAEIYFLPKDDKNVNINRNIKFDEYFNPKIIDGTYMISYEYINYLTGKYVYEKEKGLYLFNTIYISDKEMYEMERNNYIKIKYNYILD